MPLLSPAPPAFDLADEADKCVKCGLCLPHCPTYTYARLEAESPRGRIAIAEHLAADPASGSPAMRARLDSCLTCRRCEVVCPAGVQFGNIIDAARLALPPVTRGTHLSRYAATMLRHTGLRRLARWALLIYWRSGVQALARRSGLLRGRLARLDRYLQKETAGKVIRDEPAHRKDPIHLLSPCASNLLDQTTARDAKALIQALGYQAIHDTDTACCGALAYHSGRLQQAQADQRALASQLEGTAPIVCTGSGCSLMLREHHKIAPAGAALSKRSLDLCEWLDREIDALSFAALHARVGIHTPCSMANGLGQPDLLHRLLSRIPGVELVNTGPVGACCGAGGDHFLQQPERADALARLQLETAQDARVDILVSANVGCAMHLRAGLDVQDFSPEVLHPVSLLLRQLQRSRASGSATPPGAAAPVPPTRPG